MKAILAFLLTIFVLADCNHLFVGSNVQRPMLYHHNVEYSARMFRKRVENQYYSIPAVPSNIGRTIQGILGYDLTNTGASMNITQGGIGFNFVNLRMKSDRGERLHYDVYIYA